MSPAMKEGSTGLGFISKLSRRARESQYESSSEAELVGVRNRNDTSVVRHEPSDGPKS